jgi:hypothetical protein
MTLDPMERKRGLNFREACIKARELWGDYGQAMIRYENHLDERYVVGTIGAGQGQRTIGKGRSWDDAFAQAEHRAAV